jgi:hypothetical protein
MILKLSTAQAGTMGLCGCCIYVLSQQFSYNFVAINASEGSILTPAAMSIEIWVSGDPLRTMKI